MLNDLFLGCRVAGFLEGLAAAKSCVCDYFPVAYRCACSSLDNG